MAAFLKYHLKIPMFEFKLSLSWRELETFGLNLKVGLNCFSAASVEILYFSAAKLCARRRGMFLKKEAVKVLKNLQRVKIKLF